MGYRIWRKDNNVWSLAFDVIYETFEKTNERIEELNAVYHDMIKYGELQFLAYLDYIKIARDGSIIDNNSILQKNKVEHFMPNAIKSKEHGKTNQTAKARKGRNKY